MSKARTFHFLPFSHVPATSCVVPGSTLVCRVYPARIEVFDYSDAQCSLVQTIELPSLGPLEQFTVTQNLEKGHVQVSGFSPSGYICYQLYATKEAKKLGVKVLKGPLGIAQEHTPVLLPKRERLHLGVFKKQCFPDLQYRAEITEFLPLWFMLSQSVGPATGDLFTGPSLCTQVKENFNAFKDLFRAGFTSLLTPRLIDTDHQGYLLPITANPNQSPLLLLHKMYPVIRKLFIVEEDNTLYILPALSRTLHSGYLSCTTKKGHELCIEWSKHWPRTIHIKAASDDALALHFLKECRNFRLSTAKRKKIATCQNKESIELHAGREYLLDQFQA